MIFNDIVTQTWGRIACGEAWVLHAIGQLPGGARLAVGGYADLWAATVAFVSSVESVRCFCPAAATQTCGRFTAEVSAARRVVGAWWTDKQPTFRRLLGCYADLWALSRRLVGTRTQIARRLVGGVTQTYGRSSRRLVGAFGSERRSHCGVARAAYKKTYNFTYKKKTYNY